MAWRPRHKYGNIRTVCDNILFQSKLESRCYEYIKLKKAAGEVIFFLRQVPIHFASGVKYVIDFLTFNADGSTSWIEAKGVETATYKLKKKLLAQEYPMIEVQIFK